ncbi:MAG: S8 family serine peptidase, partial [candidate division Zixibacteria bacterium]|nr:S8 family serine peptidase [candidate division Zixibacteria bacterium]
ELPVRWMGPVKPEYKISPMLTALGIGPWAQRENNRAQFLIVFHRDEDFRFWAARFQDEYNAEILGYEPTINGVDMILPDSIYDSLAALDAVLWIEPALPFPEEHNDANRVSIGADSIQGPPYNLDGSGVTLTMWDGGQVDATHPDFDTRVTTMDASAITTHATHVAGTIMGSGAESEGTYRGMAPAVHLLTHLWWTTASELYQDFVNVIDNYDADIGTNSWGYGVGDPATEAACETTLGNYFAVCATIDNIIRGSAGKPVDMVWSAGNQRGSASKYCGSIGWTYNTINPLGCPKNVITVGAINADDDSMTGFSSWGPVDDGRIKPDVVAAGCQTNDDLGVTSCRDGGGYTTMCGTSMSAPTVTGLLALMQQHWLDEFGSAPILPSTVKGILINTALDLGNPGPDYQFGHGKVDGVKAIDKLIEGEPSYVESEIFTNDHHLYYLDVHDSAQKLKVTLTWDDPGGTVNSSRHLKNDLDLILIDPTEAEYLPWVLDKDNPEYDATRGVDRINNVETVEVDSPSVGIWKAKVSGYNIVESPQKYSIVFSPDSINILNSMNALAIYSDSDSVVTPGDTILREFLVTNIGLRFDSVTVGIIDDAGWAQDTMDTVIYLTPSESALFVIPVVVPEEALANEKTFLTCQATSRTTPLVSAARELEIKAAAIYLINVTDPLDDTVTSPDSFSIDLLIENQSNAANIITVSLADELGWQYVPDGRNYNLAARSSTNTSFAIIVPAEEPHLDTNLITVQAHGYGGLGDTSSFNAIIYNPYPPPVLIFPEALFYTQEKAPSFEWEGEADSFGLYLTVDSLMTYYSRVYKNIDTTFFTIPEPDSLMDGAYYWAVRKFVDGDSSSYQRYPRKLVIDNIPPDSLILISPDNGAYLNEAAFEFVFDLAEQPPPSEIAPEFNIIQLSRDYSMFTIDLTFDSIVSLTFPIPVGIDDDCWYWRMQRYDLAGNYSVYSGIYSFILDTQAPPPPEMTYPPNTAFVLTDTLVFRWQSSDSSTHIKTPEYYLFHLATREDFSDTLYGVFVYDDSLALDSSFFKMDSLYYWRLQAFDSAGFISEPTEAYHFTFKDFVCGDINQSGGEPDISDITFLIAFLYLHGPVPDPLWLASVNCDMEYDISDVTALISFLYLSHDPLCCEPF